MTDLPAPPPRWTEPPPPVGASPKRGIGTALVVGALILAVALAFWWLTDKPTAPEPARPSPSIVPSPSIAIAPRSITLAQLQRKNDRAAFFLGRGQPEGAGQIIRDTLSGSDCDHVFSAWAPFSSRRAAQEQADLFLREARASFPGALIAASVVKADEPEMVGGWWVLAGLVVACP